MAIVIIPIRKRPLMVTEEEKKKLIQMASDLVPFGIYAVEKDGQVELRNDKCRSITQLKEKTRQFKSQSFKVYANGR